MEEQRTRALPENLTGDGNTIAGPSDADIDSPSNSIAGPSSAGIDSSPTSALPPNPSDIAGDGRKRKRHAEKKDKKAKKMHQKRKKDHKRPNKRRKSKVASDEDDENDSGTQGSSNPSESESGEDDEDSDDDDDEEEDDDEPVNTRLTKHTSMDPKHWKSKPATAVNTKDIISIDVTPTNTATVSLPSVPPTAPLPLPPLSQPLFPVCPSPASPSPVCPLPTGPPPPAGPSPPASPPPPATASAHPIIPTPSCTKASQEASWPSWFSDAHVFLSSQDLGPDFTFLIKQFTDLERLTDFAPAGRFKGFKSDNRPEEVRYWISRGRATQPKVDKVSEFEKSWWKWWKGLQPDWRAVSDVVGPLDSSHHLGLVDGADWSAVNKHGRNAFFSVMATLVWWGVVLPAPSTSDEGWMAAVQDVGWVLAGLTGSRFVFHINYYLSLIYLALLHSLPTPISTSTSQAHAPSMSISTNTSCKRRR